MIMKKFTKILLTVLIFCCSAYAQQITSINIIPATPADTQDVKVILSAEFGAGDCPLIASYYNISNDTLHLIATYDLGILAVICGRTDTIDLGLMSCALHTLHVQVVESGSGTGSVDGYRPLNITCTPTGIKEPGLMKKIYVYTDPITHELNIKYPGIKGASSVVSIINILGEKKYSSTEIQAGNVFIKRLDINNLAKGVYFVKIETSAGSSVARFIKD